MKLLSVSAKRFLLFAKPVVNVWSCLEFGEAETFARILTERQAENDAKLQALDAETRAQQAVGRTRELVRKIQQFFGLGTDATK